MIEDDFIVSIKVEAVLQLPVSAFSQEQARERAIEKAAELYPRADLRSLSIVKGKTK